MSAHELIQAAHAAALPHELVAIDAFVEDFNVAKRAQTLRSKQARLCDCAVGARV
jgi:hypothetical protein